VEPTKGIVKYADNGIARVDGNEKSVMVAAATLTAGAANTPEKKRQTMSWVISWDRPHPMTKMSNNGKVVR
jgi:hypothetical protein